MEHRIQLLSKISQRTDQRDATLLFIIVQGLVACSRIQTDLETDQIIERLLKWLEQIK